MHTAIIIGGITTIAMFLWSILRSPPHRDGKVDDLDVCDQCGQGNAGWWHDRRFFCRSCYLKQIGGKEKP